MKQLKPTTSYKFKEETLQTKLAKSKGSLIGSILVIMSRLPESEVDTAIYATEAIIEVLDPESQDYLFVMDMLNERLKRFNLYL